MSIGRQGALLSAAITMCGHFAVTPAFADEQAIASSSPEEASAPAAARAGDIIVTARKRQESLLNVPVIETALPAEKLQQLQSVDLKDLTKLAPGLLIGTSILSIGQLVSIRGVGTSSFDPGIDQSVSLNIDGLSLGQGLAYSSGLFDLGSIEVLKGPQALFFGKSSPGGVIAIHTADPTDKVELIASGAYEAEAITRRGELIVSGPLTSTLKARIAGMYSRSNGFYYNDAIPAPGTGALAPRYSRMNRSRDYQVRGTLLWTPAPSFNARLKVNLVNDRAIDSEQFQLTSCPDGLGAPLGIPFIGGGEDCKIDRVSRLVDIDPATVPGIINNGVPVVASQQRYGTLELNYRPLRDVTVTAVTSYYDLHSKSLLNTSEAGYAAPAFEAQNPRFRRRDLTQDLRVNTDLSGPLNLTVGGFYQDAKISDFIQILGNTAYRFPAIPLQQGLNGFKVKTYSLYGQVRYKIVPQVELAAGLRWTDETRVQNDYLYPSVSLPTTGPLHVDPATPRIHSSSFAPEFTITYKPSTDLTLFAAYKKGFKSGSFSIATPASLRNTADCLAGAAACRYLDNSFGDERVAGFEGGIKGRIADRRLSFSVSGFSYKYRGLQVGAIEPVQGSIPVIRTVNAGSGRDYGVEGEVNFVPLAVSGLSTNATVSWTHARFQLLNNVPCYGGQTIAAGCNQQFVPSTGLYTAQDLSGSPFVRAPDWQATFGFTYERPLSNGWSLQFTNSNNYSARYLTALGRRPDLYQDAFFKIDLGLTLKGQNDRWELAAIGKNITERLTTSSCVSSNFAGGSLGGQITGGTGVGPAGIDEVGCYMDSGREVWLRLTLRPFN